MSANTRPPPTNGVITEPARAGNRKKQKRRAKQAAKNNASHPLSQHYQDQPADMRYDEEPLRYDDEDDYDSEAVEYDHTEDHPYADQMAPVAVNGVHPPPAPPASTGKKNKKKNRKSGSLQQGVAYDTHVLPPLHHSHAHPGSNAMSNAHRGGHHHGNIWNTSTQQERHNIKEFWLSLSEEERKGLLKIEKEAVLKKMKQQQKHSCSCTVCGRKRTAIEEELEVLYEGYYEELEQYAHHDAPPGLPTADGMIPPPLQHRPHPLATPPPPLHPPHPHPHHRTSHIQEHLDDEEDRSSDGEYEEDEEEDEEEYSDEEEEEEEEYSDEEHIRQPEPPRGHPGVPDFFNFGSHLTVKGILTPWVEKLREGLKGNADNLLTVADDLLKNDGRKFIEMMEQLAERRMAREQRSQYEADTHSGYPPGDPAYDHDDALAEDEYDDDEASYDSQDEYDDEMEDDEMVGDLEMASHTCSKTDYLQGGLTEEQRMQEGRRMFQIFAARMFEQRVLTAYREKVAAERQQKLLEELEDEGKLQKEREAKKQRDAQKKKDKKKQQQLAKAEEKAKRDAEKAEEEARLREAEEKKQEEQRRKKEEQRKKREEEKKRQEEERARKESERLRRQQEEQQRREEAERKAREQKAAEKARKEEQRKREREEREAREKEARERKAQEEKEKKEREANARAEKEAKERQKSVQPSHAPSLSKRPSQATVAIPSVYGKQTASGVSSPHPSIATPAIPKAPTPNKPRQQSQQGSHASSPKQSHSQLSSAPSKSSSPGSNGQQAQAVPKHILQKPQNQHTGQQLQHPQPTPSPMNHQQIQPPPGMPHPQHHHPGGFGGPPMGFPGFPHSGPMGGMGMGQRGQMPVFPNQQHSQIGYGGRMGFPGMNGMPPPPPGMMPPHGRGFPFDNAVNMNMPPGFGLPQAHPTNQTAPLGPPAPGSDAPRQSVAGHSRQQSSDKERFESAANQPIQRPAPIQRPGSVRPQEHGGNGSTGELDDLSNHLGSSALLDDADEPMPNSAADARRHSNIPTARGINIPGANMGPMGPLGAGFGAPGGGFTAPGSSWNNTPAGPFGNSPNLGGQQWGGFPPSSSWSANNAAFGPTGGFGAFPGSINRPGGVGHQNRPLTVRQSLCNACRQLSAASRGEGDDFHDANTLIRHIMSSNTTLDSPPTLEEVEVLCGTEGNSQNGGGELHIRRNEGNGSYAVKWTADAGTPDQNHRHSGLGEIGSPMPSKTSPVGGFGGIGVGRGFSNIGSPST